MSKIHIALDPDRELVLDIQTRETNDVPTEAPVTREPTFAEVQRGLRQLATQTLDPKIRATSHLPD